jgi:hypothetical protein
MWRRSEVVITVMIHPDSWWVAATQNSCAPNIARVQWVNPLGICPQLLPSSLWLMFMIHLIYKTPIVLVPNNPNNYAVSYIHHDFWGVKSSYSGMNLVHHLLKTLIPIGTMTWYPGNYVYSHLRKHWESYKVVTPSYNEVGFNYPVEL